MEDEIVNCVNGIRYVHRPYLKKSAYDEKEGVVYDFGDVGRHQICSLLNRLDQRVKDLEGQLDKIPPSIKEVWLDD